MSCPRTVVGKFNWHVPHFRRSQEIYGAFLCAVAAGLIALCLHARPLRTSVIFPFLLVVIFVARHFGATAAMVGATLAAAVFSRFMLPPIGSFRIEDVTAKETLLWFLVAGITLGYLFAPVPPDQDQKS
jgi:K+-sensing histidine kinase KdpD